MNSIFELPWRLLKLILPLTIVFLVNHSFCQSSTMKLKSYIENKGISPLSIRFKLNEKGIQPKDNKIIALENDVITILLNTAPPKDSGYVLIRLPVLPTEKPADYVFEEQPKRLPDGTLQFIISNFKPGNSYHYKIIYAISSPEEKLKTKIDTSYENTSTDDTKKINGNIENTTTEIKKKTVSIEHTSDTATSSNETVVADFFVEPHEVSYFEVEVGGYAWQSYQLPNYVLVDSAGLKIIKDNGTTTGTGGVLVGGGLFPFGHDEKSLWNSNSGFWKNVSRNVGVFAGVGFSKENGAFENLFVGIDVGLFSANILFGGNLIRINSLIEGYTVNTIYSGQQIADITSSKHIWHFFLGATANLSVLEKVLTFLTGAIFGK